MSISVEELNNLDKGTFKVILVPEEHTEDSTKWTYTTFTHDNPITADKKSEFVIAQQHEGISKLYLMDRVNWKNHHVKNLSNTPDGKPYRCLFITEKLEGIPKADVPATVLGTMPDIYVLTLFSTVYILLSHFKTFLQKLQNGEHEVRLLSDEDMIDSLCDQNKIIQKLVQENKIDLKSSLESICECVSVPNMDSDDESEDQFYKPSLDKIIKFTTKKIEGLTNILAKDGSIQSLKLRMETMYPSGIPDDIKLLLWKKQSIELLSNYIDQWYLDETIKLLPIEEYDFDRLYRYMQELKGREQAQDLIDESIQQLHEGTASVLSAQKKSKPSARPVVKATKAAKPKIAVGKGALDMFFKKKEQ